jgi:hypothetical protein
MLGYLDSLIAALDTRETRDIERLLRHPLARILPPDARREAEAFRDNAVDSFAAPLRVMQLRHQTAELLKASAAPPATPLSAPPRVTMSPPARQQRTAQMELPLSA